MFWVDINTLFALTINTSLVGQLLGACSRVGANGHHWVMLDNVHCAGDVTRRSCTGTDVW